MTSIAAAAAGPSSGLATTAGASSAVAVSATASPTSTTAASQPAVAGSFGALASSAAAAGSNAANVQPPTVSATADQVERIIEGVQVTNDLIWDYNHIDFNGLYKLGGAQAVTNFEGCTSDLVSQSVAATKYWAALYGIPVTSDVTQTDASPSTNASPSGGGASSETAITVPDLVITGSLTIGAFNFTSDDATYAVTTDSAGQTVGTEYGQAWQSWSAPPADIPSTADELAALVASLASGAAKAASSVVATATIANANIDLSA